MIMSKELTAEDFSTFCDDFADEKPDLEKELPSIAFMNGKILCHQPQTMPNDRWNEYLQYKDSWLLKNEFE